MRSPSYRIAIKDIADKNIIDCVIRGRKSLRQDGIAITFSETKQWVRIKIVRDPFLYLLYLGFGIVLIGLLLYPFRFVSWKPA